jgi:hypothetical protein
LREPKLKTTANNPFTELAELRLEFKPNGEKIDIQCRLIFGRMRYDHKEREYEIGLRRAFLGLALEGCETTLEPEFGENELSSVVEENALESKKNLGASVSSSTDPLINSVGLKIAGDSTSRQNNHQKRARLPMTRKPGNRWEIVSQSVSGSGNLDLDGTVMSGQKLCTLQRKDGGNRLAATGEVQIERSAITVTTKGGNKLGKVLSEWQNKDSIVSQILKQALQREAIGGSARTNAKVVVVSKAEVSEE